MTDTGVSHIRNFSIIAHIDHGKSTLADRFLEMTETVVKREMKEQVLDVMELERERGITIKMQPARMRFVHEDMPYQLNLIDTPGHIDFSYEVSRALAAVEGVILLVDATQGVQAQTLTTLRMAQEKDLTIIPVVTKIDMAHARIDDVTLELAELLDCPLEEVLSVSGKTGEGVIDLLEAVVERVPPPEKSGDADDTQLLVFDFEYSTHQGVIIYARVVGGSVEAGETVHLKAGNTKFAINEVGIFTPAKRATEKLLTGEIGYVVTGLKEAGVAKIGDTIVKDQQTPALPGYTEPQPVVWASVYPESQDDLTLLRQALERLRLNDASLSYEEESSGVIGRGFRCGFLGMLHLEIVVERLRREFALDLIVTSPSITYDVTLKSGETEEIQAAYRFPHYGDIDSVREPWVAIEIISPSEYVSSLMQLFHEYEVEVEGTKMRGDGRTHFSGRQPLRALMRGFFDALKQATSGYASLSYAPDDLRPAEVSKIEILVAEELIPAFTRIVSEERVERVGRDMVERLHELLPQQLFATKIQARVDGRIVASKTLKALRKNVTAGLYGGDVTRKRKLREKQKQGKKRMQEDATAVIPQEVFIKMMRNKN